MKEVELSLRAIFALSLAACFAPSIAKAEESFLDPPPRAAEEHPTVADLPLEFSAPASCPDESAFRGMVLANLTKPRDLRQDDSRLIVHVNAEGTLFEGSFRLEGEAGALHDRVVSDEDCGEVLGALSMVAAIALEPLAEGDQESRPPEVQEGSPRETAQESSKVTLSAAHNDEPEPETSGSRADRPGWMAPFRLRHQTRVKEGTLKVEAAVAFDAQVGVGYGLTPKTWNPRLDFSARTALFLKPPHQPSFLLGVIPRIRFSFWDPSTRVDGSYESTLSGMSFALGLCGSPYYDPEGLVLLICGEYGGGTVQVATRDRDSDFERTIDIGIGKSSFSLEAEVDLLSVFHLGLRSGVELLGAGDYRIEDAAQNELFQLGKVTFFATAGVGVHF